MMIIVRKLRTQRETAIKDFKFKDPMAGGSGANYLDDNSSNSKSQNQSNSSENIKSRKNNYDKVFA